MSEETIVLEVIGENEICCFMRERTIRRTLKRTRDAGQFNTE